MATEAGRHLLYEKISTEWGQEYAEELMSYLPPVGWADVATKHDLDAQTVLLRSEMNTLAAELRGEMQKGFASQLRWMIGTMIAMTGIFSFIVANVH
jgi:hypothetical protein